MTDHASRTADHQTDRYDRSLECDLIMKGGVTSGIVYPGAIGAITQRYRLRNIGGTSAGAIAAAAAAAMEYGLRSGRNPQAREQMMWLSQQTALRTSTGGSYLQALFEPDPATAPLLHFLMPRSGGRWAAALNLLGRPFAGWLALTVAPAIIVGLAYAKGPLHWSPAAATLVGLFCAGLMMLVTIGALLHRALNHLASRVVDNGLGIMTGMAASGARVDGVAVPGLTQWLHNNVQSLAGRTGGTADDVLTFGELWTVDSGEVPSARKERGIDLVLVCSDLNRLESVSFPFLPQNERLFYNRCDWNKLFPADVMAAMELVARPIHKGCVLNDLGYTANELCAAADRAGLGEHLRLLPKGKDLPIIVGARASMAFPGLFTPLPLWILRWKERPEKPGERQAILSRVYLSDGGITSNFPIHLFDGVVPNRPTFAVNLLYPGDDLSIEEYRNLAASRSRSVPQNVRSLAGTDERTDDAGFRDLIMPFANSDRVRFYKAPADGDSMAQLLGLAMRVVETARTWADVSHYNQTGTRDRVIHIRLSGAEGGFNLDMDKATIESIDNKGSMAGTVLASRFDPSQPTDPLDDLEKPRFQLDWMNHRIVRMHGFIAAQDLLADRFNDCFWPKGNPGLQVSNPLTRDLLTPGTHFHEVSLRLDAMGALPVPSPDPHDRVLRPMAVLRMRPATSDPRSTQRP